MYRVRTNEQHFTRSKAGGGEEETAQGKPQRREMHGTAVTGSCRGPLGGHDGS